MYGHIPQPYPKCCCKLFQGWRMTTVRFSMPSGAQIRWHQESASIWNSMLTCSQCLQRHQSTRPAMSHLIRVPAGSPPTAAMASWSPRALLMPPSRSWIPSACWPRVPCPLRWGGLENLGARPWSQPAHAHYSLCFFLCQVMMNETAQQNMENHPVIRTLYDHVDEVTCLAFHPSEQILASGSRDYTLKLFDYSKPSAKRAFKYIQVRICLQDVSTLSLFLCLAK